MKTKRRKYMPFIIIRNLALANQTKLVKARGLNAERFGGIFLVRFILYESCGVILVKDLNGDWLSKDGDYKAFVFCQTRDYWRHHVIKRCKYETLPDPPSDLFPDWEPEVSWSWKN